MKRILLLGVVFAGLGVWSLHAQGPTPEVIPRYRLFQVVEPSTLQQKIEESAAQGYRLIQVISAPGGSMAAIMKKVRSPTSPYEYGFRDLKFGTKISEDFSEQLSQFAAKGFHFHSLLNPSLNSPPRRFTFHFPDVLLVMEKSPGTNERPQYGVVSPGLAGMGSFNQKKIASLLDQDYILLQPAWLWKSLLIFEQRSASDAAIAAKDSPHAAHSSQGYKFLISRWNPYSIPEKEIQKASREGSRIVAIIRLSVTAIAAATVQPDASSGPYEYLVVKRRQRSISNVIATEKADAQAAEDEMNRAGENGFRLVQKNILFEPILMEKAPGSTEHFHYRFMISANLSEFSPKLEEVSNQGYKILVMSEYGAGIAAVMEKSETAFSQ